ncbi:MAG: hypothetical protein ACK5MZ_04390 [Aestuariibaculum sp.]
MKKLLILAVALSGLQIFAQDENRERPDKREKMEQYTPEEMAGLHTKRMTLDLDLNKSQQDDVYKINLENAERRKAKMEAFKVMRENDEKAKPSKEERLKMANERLDHQIEQKAKMRKILNDEQYAKWEKNQDKMETRAKNRGSKKMGRNKNKNRK